MLGPIGQLQREGMQLRSAPSTLTPTMLRELDSVGAIRFGVASNRFHHLRALYTWPVAA